MIYGICHLGKAGRGKNKERKVISQEKRKEKRVVD